MKHLVYFLRLIFRRKVDTYSYRVNELYVYAYPRSERGYTDFCSEYMKLGQMALLVGKNYGEYGKFLIDEEGRESPWGFPLEQFRPATKKECSRNLAPFMVKAKFRDYPKYTGLCNLK